MNPNNSAWSDDVKGVGEDYAHASYWTILLVDEYRRINTNKCELDFVEFTFLVVHFVFT